MPSALRLCAVKLPEILNIAFVIIVSRNLVKMEMKLRNNKERIQERITFPSFASDKGSEVHDELACVNCNLFKDNLAKLPKLLLENSLGDFLPIDVLGVTDLSGISFAGGESLFFSSFAGFGET